MGEGAHVLAQGGREVLGLDEPQVLAARVAQDVAEQSDAPPALGGEVDVVDGVIHLGLGARAVSKRTTGDGVAAGAKLAEPLAWIPTEGNSANKIASKYCKHVAMTMLVSDFTPRSAEVPE